MFPTRASFSIEVDMSVFATKDGIENIFLRFDKNPPKYRAGECLSGKIIVECGFTTPVKGIKVCTKKCALKIDDIPVPPTFSL